MCKIQTLEQYSPVVSFWWFGPTSTLPRQMGTQKITKIIGLAYINNRCIIFPGPLNLLVGMSKKRKIRNFIFPTFFLVKCPSIFLNLFETSDTVFLSFNPWRFQLECDYSFFKKLDYFQLKMFFIHQTKEDTRPVPDYII